jgi:GNAT superfamily N-acetyltransferase
LPYLPLDSHHDRQGFDCGNEELNRWLKQVARQHKDKRISTTIVAVSEISATEILGYYAITVGEAVHADLPEEYRKRMPDKAPVFLLARLATAKQYQGMKIGEGMLFDAIDRVTDISNNIGGIGLIVDAKDDAIEFYRRYGFKQTPDHSHKLFLKI